jgi:hypothetical protein
MKYKAAEKAPNQRGGKRFKKFADANRGGVMAEDKITSHGMQHDLIDAEINSGGYRNNRDHETTVEQAPRHR